MTPDTSTPIATASASAPVPPSILRARDGINQAGRVLPALAPDYVAVDERSLRDLLAFARDYAKTLRFFDSQTGQPVGDWQAFLGTERDLDDIVTFLQAPTRLSSASVARYTRPHLALFLTFLDLLQQTRPQLNDLTRRHLEFYYREALRLTAKAAQPDQVYALIELADQQEQYRLPAGTLLAAGQDSQGLDRFYRTTQVSLINRAQVASLKSLCVQKQVLGLHTAHQDPVRLRDILAAERGTPPLTTDPCLLMLMLALGDPNPGAPLPHYVSGRNVDDALLKDLDKLLAFINNDLGLSLAAFRTLMELKHKQERGMAAEWKDVNEILTTAGKKRKDNFALKPDTPQDFEANLKNALGVEAGDRAFFGTLAEVNDIYDLYRVGQRTERSEEVIRFVETNFYMSLAQFNKMMANIDKVYNNRRRLYAILRAAARKKQRQQSALGATALHADSANHFDTLRTATLGELNFSPLAALKIQNVEDCYQALLDLEAYFYMPAEDYALLRDQFRKGDLQPWEWAQVDAIVTKAHQARQRDKRQQTLGEIHQAKGFTAMLQDALGDPAPNDELPEKRAFLELDAVRDAQYIQQQLYLEPENFTNIQSTAKATNPAPTEQAWQEVYKRVELAQRRKRGIVDPPPQIELWQNLYAAADATQVQVQRGLPEEQVTPRWRTFGDGYRPETTPGRIGFALASPLLALAEGKRTITLTLRFDQASFDQVLVTKALAAKVPPFRFWLSSEKQMVEVTPTAVSPLPAVANAVTKPAPGLQVILALDPQAPPVAPMADASDPATPWPVLQMVLADVVDPNAAGQPPQKSYLAFQSLVLTAVELQVEVNGITQLTLQNDDGILNAKKPFEPFGFAPVVGSNFTFAHSELCTKRLDTLHMKLEWLGAPDNFQTHYQGYQNYQDPKTAPTSPVPDNTYFQARLKLYNNRTFLDVDQIQLFHAEPEKPTTGATQPQEIGIVITDSDSEVNPETYASNLALVTAAEALDWNRYWQLELALQDFQHAIYPYAAAGCAGKVEKDKETNTWKPNPEIINPPYTPKLKRLTLGYTASAAIHLEKSDPATAVSLYHLEPFGAYEVTGDAVTFLPQYADEGELFIGLTALAPPQRLTLLVQVAEGSADPALPPTPVHWWVLSGNQWLSLEQGHLLADATNGLRNSGLITFDLPTARPNTRLPAALYWLRATIAQHSRSVGDLVAIHTQAVQATFVDQGNATDPLNQPLPPATITNLAEQQPAVKAVAQPYSSSGGRAAEQPSHFYTRVSERLRHKNRALTSWDYERLVLEAFPSIYKVKCLPVGVSDDPRLADQVQIIVIPDIRGKLPFDPFEPKAATDTLAAITTYLQSQSSPFARFVVKNPSYVRLEVRMGVRFRPGYNPGWATATLQQDLQRYLAPWAYDQSAEIVFGGTINANLIVNFVERLPYIEYVAGIQLYTRQAEGGPTQVHATYTIPPDAILVADRQHQIDAISSEVYKQEFFTGINYMKIELDFKVAEDSETVGQ